MLDAADRPQAMPVRRRGRPPQNGSHAVDEEALLGLTFDTFAKRGYEGTTLREIAKQLGVSHNLLNVRYGKKADLWKRAVDWRMTMASAVVEEAFDEDADAETRLRHLIHRFCRWATVNSDIVGLSQVEGRHATWRLDYIAEHFILPFKMRLDALIAEVATVRPVTSISSAALLTLLVQGVGYFFDAIPMQQRIGAAHEVEPQNLERQAATMGDFILAGLLPTR